MFEPPYDCSLCRIELDDMMFNCAEGDITVSLASFITSANLLAEKFDMDLISVVRFVMIDLHTSHGGYDEA